MNELCKTNEGYSIFEKPISYEKYVLLLRELQVKVYLVLHVYGGKKLWSAVTKNKQTKITWHSKSASSSNEAFSIFKSNTPRLEFPISEYREKPGICGSKPMHYKKTRYLIFS